VIEAYMNHIQCNAEIAVRNMLKLFGTRFKQRTKKTIINAVDYLDDGSPIKLRIEFNLKKGEALFDFKYIP